MGIAASVLIPTCAVSTSCLFVTSQRNILLGCLLPIACELVHVVSDAALRSEGKLYVDETIAEAAQWRVVQFGIRSYSLNCCGRWNPVLDVCRKILAPWSTSFSGAMVHDVIVAVVQDPVSKEERFILLSKGHHGHLSIQTCQDFDEVDMRGKPKIFGQPKRGWWKIVAKDTCLCLQDIIDLLVPLRAVYQPVSNNCHHFSKELWNGFALKMKEKGYKEKLIRFPRGRPQRLSSFHSQKSCT